MITCNILSTHPTPFFLSCLWIFTQRLFYKYQCGDDDVGRDANMKTKSPVKGEKIANYIINIIIFIAKISIRKKSPIRVNQTHA